VPYTPVPASNVVVVLDPSALTVWFSVLPSSSSLFSP